MYGAMYHSELSMFIPEQNAMNVYDANVGLRDALLFIYCSRDFRYSTKVI